MRRHRLRRGPLAPLRKVGSSPLSEDEYERWRGADTWDPARDGEVTVQTELAPAAWIEPRLLPGTFEVQMTVPRRYEAYARIFYPFVGDEVEADGKVHHPLLTWSEMASRHGRVAHALMEKETISRDRTGRVRSDDTYGALSPEQLEALLPILAGHTASTTAWFLLWDGWGDLNERVFNSSTPKVSHNWRDFYLLRGPLLAFEELPHDPNYFWPEDRSWCLCTDCDFEWAYLAGSAACVGEVLAVPVIDAFATRPDNPARSGMDAVNDPDGSVPRR